MEKKNEYNAISDAGIVQLFLLRDEKALQMADVRYGRELFGVARKILDNLCIL